MNIAVAIFEGLCGTLLMTLFVNMMADMADRRIKVINVLTHVLHNSSPLFQRFDPIANKNAARIVHYGIGIIFSILFNFTWMRKILPFSFLMCLVLGFASGIIAAALWRIIFLLKKNASPSPITLFLTVIAFGHVIFGVGVYLAYQLIKLI